VPAQGLVYCATLHTSAPHWVWKHSLLIFLLDSQIDFWSSTFALAASSEFCLLLLSLLTAVHYLLILAFHHIFEQSQIVIIFAVASRTLPIASRDNAASYPPSSAVHSASRWVLTFASTFRSFSAASVHSSIIAATFHPTTNVLSGSSCWSASTSHSITTQLDCVASLMASIYNCVIGRFARVTSRTDSPSWPSLVQGWVTLPSCPIYSPFCQSRLPRTLFSALFATWDPPCAMGVVVSSKDSATLLNDSLLVQFPRRSISRLLLSLIPNVEGPRYALRSPGDVCSDDIVVGASTIIRPLIHLQAAASPNRHRNSGFCCFSFPQFVIPIPPVVLSTSCKQTTSATCATSVCSDTMGHLYDLTPLWSITQIICSLAFRLIFSWGSCHDLGLSHYDISLLPFCLLYLCISLLLPTIICYPSLPRSVTKSHCIQPVGMCVTLLMGAYPAVPVFLLSPAALPSSLFFPHVLLNTI